MKKQTSRLLVLSLVLVLGWLGGGSNGHLVGSAEAVVGRPATPISYAGVARRTTVRHAAVATPAVAAPVATAAVVAPVATAAVLTPGVGAPGVGVAPGPGVAPANLGGPVNRVGVR